MKKILVSLVLVFSVFSVEAGVLASGSGTATIREKETFGHRLYCESGLARWELSGKNIVETTVIYRKDRKVFWVIDKGRKTYFEVPAVAPGDQDMRIGILAMLYAVARQALSADQKAELELVLKRVPLPETLLDFQKVGAVRVGGLLCDRYAATSGGIKRGEYFTADATALKLSQADYEAFDSVLKACHRMYDNFDFLFTESAPASRKSYVGVPIAWTAVQAQGGKTTFSVEFKSFSGRNLDPALFQLPAGLKKEDIFTSLFNQ